MAEPTVERYCPRCGHVIPAGNTECLHCAAPAESWNFPREGVLLASFVLLGLQFGATGFVSRMYHAKQNELGQECVSKGSWR
jgi:uncharacterized OB-fold protein